MGNDSHGQRAALSDRELLEVIRDFRASDWKAIRLVHDAIDIRIEKRDPNQSIRWDGDAALSLEQPAAAAPTGIAEVREPALQPTTEAHVGNRVAADHGPAETSVMKNEVGSGETYTAKASTLGTFWIAPAPGAEPFVKPGDVVEKGQQLAIVEVMKLMTEVVAERAGTVEEVLAENGEAVNAGQPLFSIRISANGV